MINEMMSRTLSDVARKTANGFNPTLATLSLAVYLGAILLWQVAGTRATEALSGLTLHGMGGAPFVSAAQGAGRKIAFVRGAPTRSDIYVINPDGTGVTKLTDGNSSNTEPAWSPDGTKIAFTSGRDGNLEIYVMNADGTNQINLTRNAASDTSPAWSPDGGRIAFVGFVEGRGFQIHVMNADGGARQSLSGERGGDREPAWSPDGTRIAFSRDSGVHVMNQDGSSVRRLTAGFAPAWSPDNTRLAFVSRGGASVSGQTIRVINADGSGERTVAVPPNQSTGPSWSPDGTKVIYDAADYAFFIIEVDGCRTLTQVPSTSKLDRQPAWQPPPSLPVPPPVPATCPSPTPSATPAPRASDRVLFTSLRDGNAEIYVMNGDGTNQVNLTNNPAQDASAVWSPDGTKIAFTSNRTGPSNTFGRSHIYVMNADGSAVRQVTRSSDDNGVDSRVYDPAWSPDGTKLVFVSSFMGELSQLVIVNADGNGGTTLINATQAADPSWSPDGTRIAFVERGSVSNPEDVLAFHLSVVNADGSGRTRIADMPSPFDSFSYPPQASGPTWSPDGARIAFVSNRDGNDEIYTVNASGGELTRLTEQPAQDLMPAWLPDGSGVAFTGYREGQQRDIYVMNHDGSLPARLTTNPAEDFDPDWRSARQPPQPPAQSTVQLSRRGFRIREVGPFGDTITVTRLGDLSREATVDFATSDGCPDTALCTRLASERSDYVRAAGTLRFAPGEASQTINISVIDDALVEGDELFFLTLSNATGAALGAQNTSLIILTDNDSDPAAQNPIDTPHFFVRMHYLDFLGREPEPDGLNAWVGVLNRCPDAFNLDDDSPSARCDRIIVSSSFFRSAEFEMKGYFVYLFYRTSLGRRPTYAEFTNDLQKVSGQSAAEVEFRKAGFTAAWVERAEFMTLYGSYAEPSAFVDRLLQVSGLTLGGEVTRDSLVQDLQAGRRTRAATVRAVAEHPNARRTEFNGAFVTMQYFGYLRRDPEEAGYHAWLRYLNANSDDLRTMIHGFVNSAEYRSRFGRL